MSKWLYLVLIPVSRSYPRARGRLLTCYSPVRRSSTPKGLSARLACVKHAASVRPEPESNSPLKVTLASPPHPEEHGKPPNPTKSATPMQGAASMAKKSSSRQPAQTRRPPDGVVLNALAFSTLLSSQGTNARFCLAL